jgi:hypothetical protein
MTQFVPDPLTFLTTLEFFFYNLLICFLDSQVLWLQLEMAEPDPTREICLIRSELNPIWSDFFKNSNRPEPNPTWPDPTRTEPKLTWPDPRSNDLQSNQNLSKI